MSTFPVTDRTRVRRKPERGSYDRDSADAILDEGLVCHVGFVGDDGSPVVIPTLYVRMDDTLYLHGSPASRTLRALAGGLPACVTVTLVDGLVLARSAFHHSINYRSVVVFGTATGVANPNVKREVMTALVEHVIPGRSADARGPSEHELKATLVLAIALDEASVKLRTGPPIDDEDDIDNVPAWAGVLPLHVVAGAPVADAGVEGPPPAYVTGWRDGRHVASTVSS